MNPKWLVPWLWLCVASVALAQAPGLARKTAEGRSSLDRKASLLKTAARQALAGRQGTILVLDVRTSAVVAKAGTAAALNSPVAPGSTVKPFVLRELLRLNKVRADEPIACRRTVRIGDRNFDCAHAVTPGPMTAATALAYSCNSYFAEVASRLISTELEDALRSSGMVGARGHLERATTQEQLRLQSLGEYGIEVTPFSLASAYQRLATDAMSGTLPAAVREGLLGSTEYGMARLARPSGLTVAGKTGTSRASGGLWTHGWFAGYAPAATPEVVIVVYLVRGRGRDASEIAATALAPLAEKKK